MSRGYHSLARSLALSTHTHTHPVFASAARETFIRSRRSLPRCGETTDALRHWDDCLRCLLKYTSACLLFGVQAEYSRGVPNDIPLSVCSHLEWKEGVGARAVLEASRTVFHYRSAGAVNFARILQNFTSIYIAYSFSARKLARL